MAQRTTKLLLIASLHILHQHTQTHIPTMLRQLNLPKLITSLFTLILVIYNNSLFDLLTNV